MKITVHCLVKNEARFVWFAVMSVIHHVDKVLLWDTGSTDGTLEILQEIKKLHRAKVDFQQVKQNSPEEFTKIRQRMLDATDAGWLFVLDGDEIWWEDSIKKVAEFVRNEANTYESFFVPAVNLVGDIYHRQENSAGRYQIAGKKGHLALRGVNTAIPGLSSDRPHGTWGWVDKDKKMVQDRDPNKIKFLDAPFIHTSFLRRAGSSEQDKLVIKRAKKLKHEIGISLKADYYYPEVFFRERPKFVESVWETMSPSFLARAFIETPLRKIKRRLAPWKVGY